MKKWIGLVIILVGAALIWHFRSDLNSLIKTRTEHQKRLPTRPKQKAVQDQKREEAPKPETEVYSTLSISCPGATIWFDNQIFHDQMQQKVKPGNYPLFCFNKDGWSRQWVLIEGKDIDLTPELKSYNDLNQKQELDNQLSVLWSQKLKKGLLHGVSISDNLILAASHNGTVFCLDQNQGKITWEKEIASNLDIPPVTWKNFGFIASPTGKLVPFQLKDGREKSPFLNDGQILGMTVQDDVLYFWTGLGEIVAVKLKENFLKGLKLKEAWRLTIAASPDTFFRFHGKPVLGQKSLFIQTSSSSIVSVSLNGKLQFKKDLSEEAPSDALNSTRSLPSNQYMKLEFDKPIDQLPTPLLEGDTAWLVTQSEESYSLVCIDLSKGKLHWSTPLLHPVSGELFQQFGLIFLGNEGGELVGIEAKTGRPFMKKEIAVEQELFSGMIEGTSLFAARKSGWVSRQQPFSDDGKQKLDLKESLSGMTLHAKSAYLFGSKGTIWKIK